MKLILLIVGALVTLAPFPAMGQAPIIEPDWELVVNLGTSANIFTAYGMDVSSTYDANLALIDLEDGDNTSTHHLLVDTKDGKVVKTIFNRGRAAALSPDGNTIWFLDTKEVYDAIARKNQHHIVMTVVDRLTEAVRHADTLTVPIAQGYSVWGVHKIVFSSNGRYAFAQCPLIVTTGKTSPKTGVVVKYRTDGTSIGTLVDTSRSVGSANAWIGLAELGQSRSGSWLTIKTYNDYAPSIYGLIDAETENCFLIPAGCRTGRFDDLRNESWNSDLILNSNNCGLVWGKSGLPLRDWYYASTPVGLFVARRDSLAYSMGPLTFIDTSGTTGVSVRHLDSGGVSQLFIRRYSLPLPPQRLVIDVRLPQRMIVKNVYTMYNNSHRPDRALIRTEWRVADSPLVNGNSIQMEMKQVGTFPVHVNMTWSDGLLTEFDTTITVLPPSENYLWYTTVNLDSIRGIRYEDGGKAIRIMKERSTYLIPIADKPRRNESIQLHDWWTDTTFSVYWSNGNGHLLEVRHRRFDIPTTKRILEYRLTFNGNVLLQESYSYYFCDGGMAQFEVFECGRNEITVSTRHYGTCKDLHSDWTHTRTVNKFTGAPHSNWFQPTGNNYTVNNGRTFTTTTRYRAFWYSQRLIVEDSTGNLLKTFSVGTEPGIYERSPFLTGNYALIYGRKIDINSGEFYKLSKYGTTYGFSDLDYELICAINDSTAIMDSMVVLFNVVRDSVEKVVLRSPGDILYMAVSPDKGYVALLLKDHRLIEYRTDSLAKWTARRLEQTQSSNSGNQLSDSISSTTYEKIIGPSFESDDEPKQITLFPNPASDVITIANVAGNSSVVMLDLNGRIVQSLTSQSGVDKQLQLDVSRLQNGSYTLIISDRDHSLSKRISIIH